MTEKAAFHHIGRIPEGASNSLWASYSSRFTDEYSLVKRKPIAQTDSTSKSTNSQACLLTMKPSVLVRNPVALCVLLKSRFGTLDGGERLFGTERKHTTGYTADFEFKL